MTTKVITNAITRELPADKTAEAGKPLIIQLAPIGDYPNVVDDDNGGKTEIVQKVDEAAIDALISNFTDKVLVDADHSSEISTDTKAMAWVTRLFKDAEKGLMAEIEPTSDGAERINGKVYRFVSAAWTLDKDDRPVKLTSVGLTNRPNLPVSPILNSKAAKTAEPGTADDGGVTATTQSAPANTDEPKGNKDDKTIPAANDGAQDNTNKPIVNKGLNMDIRAKLSLPAEATEEDIEKAIDTLKAECETLAKVRAALSSEDATGEEVVEGVEELVNACKNATTELAEVKEELAKNEAEKKEVEAAEFIAKNEDVIPEEAKEEVKAEFIEDPEKAEKTVANFRLVHDRAVLNAAKSATQFHTVKTHTVVNTAVAKKPALKDGDAFKIALNSCNGDPAKENEMIKQMYQRKA